MSTTDIKACAADIKTRGDVERWTILNALLKAGFKRLGIHKDYIHADTDSRKTQEVIWVY
jgi:hypothetical protein